VSKITENVLERPMLLQMTSEQMLKCAKLLLQSQLILLDTVKKAAREKKQEKRAALKHILLQSRPKAMEQASAVRV
jgi:hypothetical protein